LEFKIKEETMSNKLVFILSVTTALMVMWMFSLGVLLNIIGVPMEDQTYVAMYFTKYIVLMWFVVVFIGSHFIKDKSNA
jgi:hypothetical protein